MDIREALDKADASMATETVETPAAPEVTVEAAPVEAAPEVEAPKAERVRDPDTGKFAKTTKTTEKAPAAPKGDVHGAAPQVPPTGPGKADGAASSPAPSAEPAAPVVKPPQSWSPQAREAFAKAPPEVQREVDRREREITRALSLTAHDRKTAEAVQRTLAPFEGLARSQGMDAMSYAGSVMQTAAALHMGTPAQKAAVVAQIIGSYGIDLETLNAALQGQPAPAHAQPQIDPRQEIRALWEQERAEQTRQANISEAQRFIESKPEFLPYVEQDMVEILRLDRSKGGNLTPQQAYDRAVKLNEDVQAVLAQRKAAEAARTAQAATARTQAAASSVRSNPSSAMPRAAGKPASIEEAMAAADAALNGRV